MSSFSQQALTLTEALQLVGLAPCIFVVLFLLTLVPRNRQVMVPILYFLALSCAFALPLVDIFRPFSDNVWLKGGFALGKSMVTAFSFLLICQFMMNRTPSWPYWLVLAIPLVGGGPLLYADILQSRSVCVEEYSCPDVSSMMSLYNVFSSSLVFLLLIHYFSRSGSLQAGEAHRNHKYWLIISLILLHLLVLAVNLAQLSGQITMEEARFTNTIFRLTFIYLVLTSLFRVFYPAMASHAIHFTPPEPKEYDPALDLPHVEKIKALMENDRVYREMRLNRAELARRVGISDHYLSRVINRHFNKNFNELINGYRIDEAKRRLKNESSQITVIGFEVGFNSIASFNRVFKSMVGVSPTEYRSHTGEGSFSSENSLSA